MTLYELSIAMKTRVLVSACPNLTQSLPTLIMLKIKFDVDQPTGPTGLRDIYV